MDEAERQRRWAAHVEDVAAGRFQGGTFPPPTSAAVRLAEALAAAFAQDVARHGPAGPLRRVDIVGHEEPEPFSVTVHALAVDDEQPTDAFDDDAWDPLTWSTNDRELARSERVLDRDDVRAAAETLHASFPPVDDDHWLALYPRYWTVPALDHAAGLLADALRARGVALTEDFSAGSRTFED